MNDNFQFHYLDVEQKDCIPFVIHIENIAATVVRGHHLKRQIYLEPFAIGQASNLYNIHSYLMQTAVDKIEEMEDEKINNFLDFSLLCLNAGRLPINKITYFRKLAVYYEGVEKVLYRGKEKYCLVAPVISGEILLPKKINVTIVMRLLNVTKTVSDKKLIVFYFSLCAYRHLL